MRFCSMLNRLWSHKKVLVLDVILIVTYDKETSLNLKARSVYLMDIILLRKD